MDEEVDELGDGLHVKDLGIEINVEFVSFAESCATFKENLKAWESEILLVACLGR